MHTHGDPVGVKVQGGLHEIITREIEVECLPDDIPEHSPSTLPSLIDRPEHPRSRDSDDRLDEADEPGRRGDLSRGRA